MLESRRKEKRTLKITVEENKPIDLPKFIHDSLIS